MTDETPTEQPTQGPPADAPEAEPNRLLVVLVALLGLAALALLVLLIWLLWPKSDGGDSSAQNAGYPIVPVRSIVGYGSSLPESLLNPLGVAFDPDGNVWIADTGNGRILVLDQGGTLLFKMGEDPNTPGNVVSPYGIAFDEGAGRAYVADVAQRNIRVYDIATGNYLATFPNPEQNMKVFGKDTPLTFLDVEVLDGRIIATSPSGLWFFDQEGFVVGRWGAKTSGSGPGEFAFPDAIQVDEGTGHILVADSLNRRIVALDSTGETQWISGRTDVDGKISGYWQLPRGLAVGPSCNVYVVDTFRPAGDGIGDGYFQVLSPSGELLSGFGASGSSDASFDFPDHLDYYAPDDLWAVADRENQRVLLFKLTPLPAPDANSSEKYPESFAKGPFPAIASPEAQESPVAGTGECPTPGAEPFNFPWWILIVLAVAFITWRAIRRIRKDREEKRAAELAAAEGATTPTEGAAEASAEPGTGSPPAETPPEAPSVPEESPPDES